jgi:energy-coupling factor transport system permease protein
LDEAMSVFFYRDNGSALQGFDPRTKIVGLLTLFAAIALLDRVAVLAALLAGLVGLLALARSLDNLKRMAVLFLLIGATTFLLWTVSYHGPEKVRLVAGLSVYRGAFGHAARLSLRFLDMLLAGLLFLSITSLEDLSAGLVLLGVPYPVAFAFSLSFRLVIVFAATGATIVEAQKVRGNDVERGSLARRIRAYAPLLIPLIMNGLKRVETLRAALESKGFSPRNKVRVGEKYRLRRRDWLALGGGLAFLTLVIILKNRSF